MSFKDYLKELRMSGKYEDPWKAKERSNNS